MKYLAHALLTATALVGVSAFATEFQSPTGNIICGEQAGELICHVSERTNKKPAKPRPADCELDWGHEFILGKTGKPSLGCGGDYPFTGQAITLAYGKTIKGNGWQCTSAKTGMTCKNKQGRGFTLSRAKQKLF